MSEISSGLLTELVLNEFYALAYRKEITFIRK